MEDGTQFINSSNTSYHHHLFWDKDEYPNSSHTMQHIPVRVPCRIMHIRVIFAILYVIVSLGCIIGNILVIAVVLLRPKMRNVTNFLLANLAFADLCVGIFCVNPRLILFLSCERWILGNVMCKLVNFMQSVSYHASILLLVVISLERYIAIIHPMLSRRLHSFCLLRAVVIGIWSIAILNGLPVLSSMRLTGMFCTGHTNGWFPLNVHIYVIVDFVLWYAVPLLFIAAAYGGISVVLWRTSAARTASEQFLRHREPRTTVVTEGAGGAGATSGANSGDAIATEMIEIYSLAASICGSLCNLSETSTARRSSAPATAGQTHLNIAPPTRQQQQCRKFSGVPSPEQQTTEENKLPPKSKSATGNMLLNQQEKQQQAADAKLLQKPAYDNVEAKVKAAIRAKRNKMRNPLIARRKVIRLLVTIVLWFAICVFPHHCRVLLDTFGPRRGGSMGHTLLPTITILVFYFNSCINPILYAFLSDNFRLNFVQMIKCQR